MVLVVFYNAVMAVVDAAALVCLGRKPTRAVWIGVCAMAAIAAFGLAALSLQLFPTLHLAAYGVFVHAPAVLLGSAWVLRKTRPKTAIVSAALGLAIVAVAVDAFFVEPHWLDVSHLRLTTDKVQEPVRIAVLADLQTDVIGPYERRVVQRLMEEKPDVILLAGDYLQAQGPTWKRLRAELNALLREQGLRAPKGVFAVRGNVDPPEWAGIFEGLPVTAVDSTETFDLGGLRLTCLSLPDSRSTSLDVPSDKPGEFHIVLGHRPDFALGRIEADLLLAGHTHGGQVRLPGLGPLVTLSKIPRRWGAGLTDLPSGAKLLVSRGIGMECSPAPRLRFLCRPELVVIDLVPE